MNTKKILGTAVIASGIVLSVSARVAPIAAASMLLPSCDPYSCELRQCDALVSGSSLTTNHKTYTHCLSCYSDGTCETQLRDDTDTFFDCTDGTSQDCTSDVVNAEFNYCDVQ